MSSPGLVILGDQLFHPTYFKSLGKVKIFMAEEQSLANHFRYHKKKITLFFLAMRNFAEEVRAAGYSVHYNELGDAAYEDLLSEWIKRENLSKLYLFEISDRFFEKRIEDHLKGLKIEIEFLRSPGFLVSREEFKQYVKRSRKPFMKSFYEEQRVDRKILVDSKNKPIGGKFSFDPENRKRLPKKINIPEVPSQETSKTAKDVFALVERQFKNHPGQIEPFWVPTDRKQAHEWFKKFLHERLSEFGPYEDAMSTQSDFIFHSGISPLLNTGLLTPQQVVKAILKYHHLQKAPLASVEGLIRQIIGWREYIFGIYRNLPLSHGNFWNHQGCLNDDWYLGQTGIPPLDHTIQKVARLGWAHHIERLMILSNMMLLSEIHPAEAYRWFMEMFVDSADWVMTPNVFGMGQFADGGEFMTKPYICGSNYWLKMGDWKKGDWTEVVDGLYWSFIEKHQKFLAENPRTSQMTLGLKRLDPTRKKLLFAKAKKFRERYATTTSKPKTKRLKLIQYS